MPLFTSKLCPRDIPRKSHTFPRLDGKIITYPPSSDMTDDKYQPYRVRESSPQSSLDRSHPPPRLSKLSARHTQDSLEEESHPYGLSSPSEQRSLEAAVAAGAAGYNAVGIIFPLVRLLIILNSRNVTMNQKGFPSRSMDKRDHILTDLVMILGWGKLNN